MKIRNGFISNSSSSSFVLMGTALPYLDSEREQFIKEEFREEFMEDPTSFCESHDLYYTGDEDGDYVGKNMDFIDYNKTINENISKVYGVLSEFFNVDKTKIDIIGGATYEG